jgi:CHAT domain-containing protein
MFNSGLALAGANVSSGGGSDISSRTFEDGILSAYEVSALNLIGTNLVVLSACETGVGEYVNGMGVMGLRSSFRQAGAHSLIMSLWKVPDELSSRMMAGFYERWLSGESKIDALRNTSLELLKNAREEYGNSHPIHWSGFILSGKSN